jgi:hypothetical protein
MISDRRLYLSADKTRVLEEEERDGPVFLLVGADCELSAADAAKYGITSVDGRLVVKVETKQVNEPEEDKEVEASENKAIIPPENKRRKARRKR